MYINIQHLQKTFGSKKAIDIENYSVQSGEILGLVGNNGAGKTTLFRLILDLLKADQGFIEINGINVSKNEEWKKFTGAYIDNSFLIDYLTPKEYFYFIGKMYGLNKKAIDEQLKSFSCFIEEEIIEEKKLIRNFSTGIQQKIGIIATMIHRPNLLILDEPFNFLDPSSQSSIKYLLQNYNKETGATILISSHNLNHTIDICQRIALLENGMILHDLTNENKSAEQELENYFNIKV